MDRKGDTTFPSTARCSPTIPVVVLLGLFSQVTGRLVVAPQNRVAFLGESVKLDCSTDLKYSVSWEHTPLGSTAFKDVYISRIVVEPYHPRFTVQREEVGVNITAYNLVVTNISVDDVGTYRCTDRTGMGERRDAQLTVLGSPPNCTTNIGPNGFVGENDCGHPVDDIRISCSIEYAGNSAPVMQWMTTPGQDTIQPQPITNLSEKTVSSEWSFKATTSMNGTSVIWFSTQSALAKWTSVPIKTLYAKQNFTTLILSRSETVTCAVNSSQHCNYTWTGEMDESKPIDGNILEVNKPGTYLCRAQCPLHQLPCTVRGPRVEYRIESQYLSVIVVIVAIIGSCLMVGTGVAIAIWKRKSIMKKICLSDSPPPLDVVAPSENPLLDSCSRTVSNGTSSPSNSDPSLSGNDEKKPCIKEKSNNSLAPPAYEKEIKVDIVLC